MLRRGFRNTFLTPRFFMALTGLVVGFVLAYFAGRGLSVLQWLFAALVLGTFVDLLLLYGSKGRISARRSLPDKLSNGDENPIGIRMVNSYLFAVRYQLIDELPFQFQKRDFLRSGLLGPGRDRELTYTVRPVERGVYRFGQVRVLVGSPLGLVRRRYNFDADQEVPVYPSFLQLRKYELLAASNRLFELGLKRIRRIGHTMEFEQIKEYTPGDDVRNLNWKATAKHSRLMVNQYQDEKSQPIYSAIDTGRVMQMPFEGLSLLDYAINAALVLSRIAIKKQDKAGVFTFNRRVENRVAADRRSSQMQRILETLYNIKTDFAESDFARLYIDLKRNLNQRSLLLLYTNFETLDALHRQLPYLQALQRQHLLVVIFFENTELLEFTGREATTVREVFQQTIARKFIFEKRQIVRELQRYGIQALLTRPEDLTVNALNKYLEIKARGLI